MHTKSMKMPRPSTPITPLHLRTSFLRHFSTTPTPPHPTPPHHPHPLQPHHQKPLLSLSKPIFLPQNSLPKNPFSLFSLKPFSTSPPNQENQEKQDDPLPYSLSNELNREPSSESLISFPQRLDLSYSHVELTPALILSTLNLSPNAGRSILGFLTWVSSRSNFDVTDEIVSYFVDYFGRRKDFKAVNEVLETSRGVVGDKTLGACVDHLVRVGRPTQVVSFFDTMEKDYGFVRNLDSLKLVVGKLGEHGFASYAEKMVKSLANDFFPDEYVCDLLVKGWCVDKKLNEAKRLVGEMNRGGFKIGAVAYNAMLDCVCKLCREKDPFRLQYEAENVLVEMDVAGVPRNVETFNVLISNLCKIRKTEDAMGLFQRMGEWGCNPNETTFVILIKSLYQAARVGEGDEMIDRMKSDGFGDALNMKAYYEFLTILCGIKRIDHSMSVFAKMKEDGCKPGTKTYDLLIKKLGAHGKSEKANALFKEAESNGVLAIPPNAYKVDPTFAKKPTSTKKEKKRETLPEKMARKRRTLKKIRLSFVKKPKKTSAGY